MSNKDFEVAPSDSTETVGCAHSFEKGFWETACTKCGAVKIDRLYQMAGDEHSRQAAVNVRKLCAGDARHGLS
jgi:hypothetical protein